MQIAVAGKGDGDFAWTRAVHLWTNATEKLYKL